MENNKNIFARIQAVSNEVKSIEKNMNVSVGNSSYKAVADVDVTINIRKAEFNAGIVSIPIKQELVKTEIITTKDAKYGNEKIQYVDIVKMTLRIYNIDNPQEYVDIESYGRGLDSGDKGFGKASTYARKYALLNAYKIATGEDPDKDASVDTSFATPIPTYSTDDALALALDDVRRATTRAEVIQINNNWAAYKNNETFRAACNAKYNSLSV